MYLCIYIATHLHTVYQDWLQVVLVSNSRCGWEWRSSELRDTLQGHDQASFEIHLQADIQCTQRYTWRPWLSNFGKAVRGQDRVNSKIHSQAVQTRSGSSKLKDTLPGCHRASLEMQLKIRIECTQRYTLIPWCSEITNAVGGNDRVNLAMHSEVMIDGVWWWTFIVWLSEIWGVLGGRQSGVGRCEARQMLALHSSVS